MSFPLPRASFSRSAWVIEPPAVRALLDKIGHAGMPLWEYAGASPLYGIKTGLNEAFLIDTRTRDALVATDPCCSEVIRPYLRGQDIDRWHAAWAGLWMIVLKSSSDYEWPWSTFGDNAEHVFKKRFPSIYGHLKVYEQRLRARSDKGRFWWELRSCAYYDLFDSKKIIYPDLSWSPSFALSYKSEIITDLSFLLPSNDIWIVAALNSPLAWWTLWRTAIHGKDDVIRMKKIYVEQMPIPTATCDRRSSAETAIAMLTSVHAEAAASRTALTDWYYIEHGIGQLSRELADPFDLDADKFVTALRRARGRRRPLSPAGVAAVRRAWTETVAPVAARLREAERHERRLADLINAAYGLTPDEVALMWATAPPRMPISPPTAMYRPTA